LSLFCEPDVMQLFRRGGAMNVSRDAVAEVKKILVDLIAKTCSSLQLQTGADFGPKDV
jgi:hypothetical protein